MKKSFQRAHAAIPANIIPLPAWELAFYLATTALVALFAGMAVGATLIPVNP